VFETVQLPSSTVALLRFLPGRDDLRSRPATRLAERLQEHAKRLVVADLYWVDELCTWTFGLVAAFQVTEIAVIAPHLGEGAVFPVSTPVAALRNR